MKNLIKNATNIMKEKGLSWIQSLPATIKALSNEWSLQNIIPVENMSYNYVAKGMRFDDQPIVLKIGFDSKAIKNEKHALDYFAGNASIRLLAYQEKYNALLLEQALPGTTLKSLYPLQEELVMDCYVTTVQRLLHRPLNRTYPFPHIKDWLQALDGAGSFLIPNDLLEDAINLKNILLSSMTQEVVLHGDLHHDNILKNKDTWITIDPKGIIGEREFEMAAFDFISMEEKTMDKEVKKLFERRLKLLAEKSNLSAERIKKWVFVRLILSAVWFEEDNGDPSWVLTLAEKLKN